MENTVAKSWLIVGHGSDDDGYAILKTVTGTESEAKKALLKEIKIERREAKKEFDKEFEFGTNKLSDLQNGLFSTNAVWYGYSSYADSHIDFMLYDMESIKGVEE